MHCGSAALPKPGYSSHCRDRFGGLLDPIRVSVFCARLERRTRAQAVLNEPELHRAMFDVLYFPPNTPAKLKTAD